jgi:DNA-binding transcriptional ArsR family regulator
MQHMECIGRRGDRVRRSGAREDEAARVAAALAHPARVRLLRRIAGGEATQAALGRGARISQPAASKHLRVLREAGLVREARAGRARRYRLARAALDRFLALLERL